MPISCALWQPGRTRQSYKGRDLMALIEATEVPVDEERRETGLVARLTLFSKCFNLD